MIPVSKINLTGRIVLPVAICCAAWFLVYPSRADNESTNTNLPNIYLDTSGFLASTNGLGYWIWDRTTRDKQTVQLWKDFEIPVDRHVVHAELRIAADNAFKVWMDGKELGSGSDWRTLSIYELSGTMGAGIHVLAVEGFNDANKAGVIAGLFLTLDNGQVRKISSDTSWRIVPEAGGGWMTAKRPSENWPYPVLVAHIGEGPWWRIPTTVIHVRETLPEPESFLQSRVFQFLLACGCLGFAVVCLYLMLQLLSQSKAHALVQIERDRIARDIHDDLGSNITQLLLTCETAKIKCGSGAEKDEFVLHMCERARDILAVIDEVVWIVNSQHDTLEDFAIYVCKYSQYFLSSSPIRCRLDVAHDLPPKVIGHLLRRNLFLGLKEALNNAVKHSHATELAVHVQVSGLNLSLMVEDNGIGFDPSQANRERNGLANMSLRMQETGGTCEIISQPGTGCKIIFKVLLQKAPFHKSVLGNAAKLSTKNAAGDGAESPSVFRNL